MRLAVPDTLKVLLVDDWEAVTKNNQVRFYFCVAGQLVPNPESFSQLVTLPRSPTVADILEEYKEHILNNSPSKYD
jgi:mortality factor 4-like protein 1